MHPLEKFEYCPMCGSHHFVENSNASKKCENCGFEFFMNPSSANVAIITNSKGEILVERRRPPRARSTCQEALPNWAKLPNRALHVRLWKRQD